MILTREQQELLINNFINEKHTQEECIGFIEGIKRTLNTVKCNPNTSSTRGEELLDFLNYCSEHKTKYIILLACLCLMQKDRMVSFLFSQMRVEITLAKLYL